MKQLQSEERRVALKNRHVRVIHYIGQEAQSMSASLKGVPANLAIIDAMEDEAKRREAKVVVRETQRDLKALHRTLKRAILTLVDCDAELGGNAPVSGDDPPNGDTAYKR